MCCRSYDDQPPQSVWSPPCPREDARSRVAERQGYAETGRELKDRGEALSVFRVRETQGARSTGMLQDGRARAR